MVHSARWGSTEWTLVSYAFNDGARLEAVLRHMLGRLGLIVQPNEEAVTSLTKCIESAKCTNLLKELLAHPTPFFYVLWTDWHYW